MIRLAVVAEGARVLEDLIAVGDEHATLARRDRLGGVEGIRARVPPGAGAAPVAGGAMRVGAVLEQEDSLGPAVLRDPLDVEGDVATDVDEDRGPRAVPLGFEPEVLERHAEVLAVAVDEYGLAAGMDDRERSRHEGVGGAEHLLSTDAGEVEGGQGRAGPAACRHRSERVKRGPGILEALGHLTLGPALGQDDLVPELMEPGQVSAIEADRELVVVAGGQ